jgi:hypothetical protein
MKQKTSKYKAKKCVYNGVTYDSIKEGNYAKQLDLMLKNGLICNLERQVKYKWIETHEKNHFESETIEFKRSYIADFVYFDKEKQEVIVCDVKGFRTAEYKKKKKIVEKLFGFKITEI